MKKSLGKLTAYLFIILLIALYFLSNVENPSNTIKIIEKIVTYAILVFFVIALIIVIIFLIQNKKIEKMLNGNAYHKIIEYVKEKQKKPIQLRPGLNNYLLALSYVALDDEKGIKETYENITLKQMLNYPILYYWQACVEMAKGNTVDAKKNLGEYLAFINPRLKETSHKNLVTVCNTINAYLDNNYDQAKEYYSQIDFDGISMPATKVALHDINVAINSKSESIIVKDASTDGGIKKETKSYTSKQKTNMKEVNKEKEITKEKGM